MKAKDMVKTAIDYDGGPIALRYPRGNGLGVAMDEVMRAIPIGSWEVLRDGTDSAILTFGTTIPMAMEAAEQLAEQGISVRVINARFIKPLDETMLHELMSANMPILTIEEAVLQGGFGSAVLEFAANHHYRNVAIDRIGIPDEFIEHGNVDQLLEEINVTTEETVKRIQKFVKDKKQVGSNIV